MSKGRLSRLNLCFSLMRAEAHRLKAEIAELKEKLGQNSRNSSRPLSSGSPFRKRKQVAEKPGCKRGAQPEHNGAGRHLRPFSEFNVVIEPRPDACSRCGCLLLGEDADAARRQTVEITASGTLLTEYCRHALRCVACGKPNRAAWSPEAESGAFGARVKAVIGYLTGRLNVRAPRRG